MNHHNTFAQSQTEIMQFFRIFFVIAAAVLTVIAAPVRPLPTPNGMCSDGLMRCSLPGPPAC